MKKLDQASMSPVLAANLNEMQKLAVLTTEGSVKVVAGAGSGKTRVLAARFARIVEDLGVNPANILCLTFTNKAAQEMKSRIAKFVQSYNVNDFVCTLHGFCLKILRKEIYRLGYPKSFTILDEDDQKQLAKQVMEELGIDRSTATIQQFLADIAQEKAKVPYIGLYVVPSTANSDSPLAKYVKLQKKIFALDFHDLINFAVYILENHEDARKYWLTKFYYVQVDEAQDCNASDWQIIKLVSSHHGNLFVVGDPDQAIYEWRGSRPADFIDLKADKTIVLDQNYRSTPDILSVANSIIANNKKRIPKDLFSMEPNGPVPIYSHSKSEIEEDEWIASRISTMLKNGVRHSDFAILYRSSYLSRGIEQALMSKGIAYTIWGGIRFFERKEIKDAISYLRLVDGNDDLSLKRIINEPSRKVGKSALQKLEGLAKAEHSSLFETLKSHSQEKPFNREAITSFVNLIDQARSMANTIPISELLDLLLINSGLKDLYRNDIDESRLENITELINSIKSYEEANANEEVISLTAYLQDIALYTNADIESQDSVKLMTIHQAKGLEFPYVFVTGLNEGIFPNHKSIRERKQDGLEEERRLMYVAVTRAEKELFLTESEGYNSATKTAKYPSRFILEIPSAKYKLEGTIDNSLAQGTKHLVQSIDEEISDTGCAYKVGDTVEHQFFGTGKVVEISSCDGYCKVRFNGGLTRQLHPKVLKPKATISQGLDATNY